MECIFHRTQTLCEWIIASQSTEVSWWVCLHSHCCTSHLPPPVCCLSLVCHHYFLDSLLLPHFLCWSKPSRQLEVWPLQSEKWGETSRLLVVLPTLTASVLCTAHTGKPEFMSDYIVETPSFCWKRYTSATSSTCCSFHLCVNERADSYLILRSTRFFTSWQREITLTDTMPMKFNVAYVYTHCMVYCLRRSSFHTFSVTLTVRYNPPFIWSIASCIFSWIGILMLYI